MVKSVRCFFLLLISFCSVTYLIGQTNPYCNVILQKGIYDRENVLDNRAKFELAKKVHCAESVSESDRSSNTSGFIGYEAFSLGFGDSGENWSQRSESFCKSSYDEVKNSYDFYRATERINQGIVNAWSKCIDNFNGASHYVIPSSDPSSFFYWVKYRSDGKPYETKIKNLDIKGADCGKAVKKGKRIGSSASVICTRDKTKSALFALTVSSGGFNLRPIDLPPFRDTPPPPPPLELSCDEYQKTRISSVACNSKTERGYYWKIDVATDKLRHYSVAGNRPEGEELVCNESNLGKVGQSSRFPYTQDTFQAVYTSWTFNNPKPTASGCNYGPGGILGPPLGQFCGIFKATCSKQPS